MILYLSGMASAASTVMVPDTQIVLPEIGDSDTAEFTISGLSVDTQYKIVLFVEGNGIQASILSPTELKLPEVSGANWASSEGHLERLFTFTGTVSGTVEVKRVEGYSTGRVYVSVYKANKQIGQDSFAVPLTGGSVGVAVPEFPTVALPVAAIIGLVFILGRKK